MSLSLLFEDLLNEASPEEIYKKYYRDIKYDIFLDIVKSDPMSKVNGEKINRIGKYTKLILNMYRGRNLNLEDLPRVTEYLNVVYKRQIPIDIQKVLSLSELYEVVKKYIAGETKELSRVLEVLDENDYQKVFEGQEWDIFVPKTEKGACYLGVNSQWCTTWGEHSLNPSYKERTSRFDYYNKQGSMYVIINKNDVDRKYQFHFESNQYMDLSDRSIDVKKFFLENEEIMNFFFPSLTKGVNVSEEDFNRQIGNIHLIPDNVGESLVQTLLSEKIKDNPLLEMFATRNEEGLQNIFSPDKFTELEDPVYYDRASNSFIFDFGGNFSDTIEDTRSNLSYYEYESNYPTESLYDRFSDDDDGNADNLKDFLYVYYDRNSDKINSAGGFSSKQEFINHFVDNFTTNDNIINDYIDKQVDADRDGYEAAADSEVARYHEYLNFDRTSISLNATHLTIYVLQKTITINELSNGTQLFGFIEGYIENYGLDGEFESIWDYQGGSVKFEDMEDVIDDYFDEHLFAEGVDILKCKEYREELNTVINNLMGGQLSVDNEIISFRLVDQSIDCSDGTVIVAYQLKNDESPNYRERFHRGKMKISEIPTLITNYKLFEALRKITNLL